MSDKKAYKTVLALGYFDGVHSGHKAVIERAVAEAEKIGGKAVIVTFSGNLRAKFLKGEKSIFTLNERREIFSENFPSAEVFFAPISSDFLSKTGDEFLEYLDKKFDVSGYVSGEDYKFGSDGKTAEYLLKKANEKGRFLRIVQTVNIDGNKISATYLKTLLSSGEIFAANKLILGGYFVSGKVENGRKVGRKLGFPTINIKIPSDKTPLKRGVYSGRVATDGKEYKAVVNYGDKPTFGIETESIEAFCVDYSGDLYGKTVRIYFDEYLREIKKFDTQEDLADQIRKDIEKAKKIK
mgnify:CR=1 FL=1